jgi:5-methyltetrahydrofolate--homocysteine methyltransferase
MEIGARYANGLPILNSVNGELEVMDRVFPIAKKYGCTVLGLALDSNGIPQSAEDRYQIAKRIVDYAWEKYGISKNRIIIDTLTLTASSEQKLVKETVEALELVTKRLGVRTALGVSNCSFGLPNRPLLNRTFLALAMQKGLNMPIINPNDTEMMNTIYAYKVLYNIDENSVDYISKQSNIEQAPQAASSSMSLKEIVKIGLKDEIKAKTLETLKTTEPMSIINDILIPTVNEVGVLFDEQKIYLPQLMMSAEAAKMAFSVIEDNFPKKETDSRPMIMATVKGDIHDIGKNIVCVILQSYGYNVIDLGKDVPTEAIVEAYNKYNPMAIGLSALMTTTVTNMAETIKELKKIKGMCPIFVGGAVMTPDIAHDIHADYYSKDPLELIDIIRRDGIK